MGSQKGERAEVEAETRATRALTRDLCLRNEGKVKVTLPLVVRNLAVTPEVVVTLRLEKRTMAPTKVPKASYMRKERTTNTLDIKGDPVAKALPLTAAHVEVQTPGSTRRKVTTTVSSVESAPGLTREFLVDIMTANILVTVITEDESTSAVPDLLISAMIQKECGETDNLSPIKLHFGAN